MKCCRTCGESKPLETFGRITKNKDGRGPDCRECYNAARREQNPSTQRKRAAYMRKSRYGITEVEYRALLQATPACPICLDSFDTAMPCVDHDHSSGRIRGLLCRPCNRAVGMLGDDPDRLRRAAVHVGGI
jgi:hypothetical protein